MKINKALMIEAHCDDCMISAGTLHRLVRTGTEVHFLSFGTAATKDDRKGTEKSAEIVLPEWHKALDIIGVMPRHRNFVGIFPSAQMPDHAQQICQTIYDFVEREKPDLVMTLSPDDENTAHAVVGRESERVMRGRVPIVLRCQFAWNFSFGRSNMFIHLDPEDIEAKRKVIDCFESQKFRYRYSAMLMAGIILDGASVKVNAAEKFELLRGVL